MQNILVWLNHLLCTNTIYQNTSSIIDHGHSMSLYVSIQQTKQGVW